MSKEEKTKSVLNLTPVEQLALLKIDTENSEATREAVSAGNYPISITVKITGTLKVAEDYEKTQPVKPPIIDAMCLVLEDISKTMTLTDEFKQMFQESLLKNLHKADDISADRSTKLKDAYGVTRALQIYTERAKKIAVKTPSKGAVISTLFVEKV